MNSFRRFLALAVLLALAPAAFLWAQTTVAGAPTTIDYQGKALDATGNPLANTTPTNYEMWFRIYDAQEGGSIIWSEKQIVTVSKGLFSVRLGEGQPNGTEGSIAQNNLSGAFDSKARFLGVTIVISGQTPVEILPRLAFLATPFAYVANKSISAERLILNASTTATPSSINLGQVSYATLNGTAVTPPTLSDQNHTILMDMSAGNNTVALPGVTSNREYSITKKDSSLNILTITTPTGGTINGSTNSIKLKVQGDSVILQNNGGNDWWIIGDSRDSTPVGTIISSAKSSATPPPGYVACDGSSKTRTDVMMVDLYAAIGTAWGGADSTHFNVPDLRGMFLRGVDGGRNADTDRNSRTVANIGGNSGDTVGSYEGDAISSHNHTFAASGNTGNAGSHNHTGYPGVAVPNGFWGLIKRTAGGDNTGQGHDSSTNEPDIVATPTGIPTDGDHAHTYSISGTTGSSGATESRPKNMDVYYFIKY